MEDNTNKSKSLVSTLIIPLWARAMEQAKPNPIITDGKSLEIFQKLNHDTSALKNAKASQVGCCIRGRWVDDYTHDFIARYPECQIIQLGCGLDPRFERLAPLPETVMWYDLDLPEVIAVRRDYLEESANNKMIAASLFDEDWMKQLAANALPTLIVIEGVLMYFSEEKNRDLFFSLLKYFSAAPTEVAFDICPAFAVNRGKYHDSVQKVGDKKAEFLWGPKEPESQIEAWNPRLEVIRLEHMSDVDTQKRFPFLIRMLWKTPFGYKQFDSRLLAVALKPAT